MTGQLDIFGHYYDTLCVDGAQVGIIQEAGKVILHCFLQCHDHTHLEVWVISSAFLGYFMNEMQEGVFADEELGAHLVLADLMESHCSQGFLSSPFFRNSLWGALPPTVSLLNNVPASTTICTIHHISNDLGNLPVSSLLLLNSSCKWGALSGTPCHTSPSVSPSLLPFWNGKVTRDHGRFFEVHAVF